MIKAFIIPKVGLMKSFFLWLYPLSIDSVFYKNPIIFTKERSKSTKSNHFMSFNDRIRVIEVEYFDCCGSNWGFSNKKTRFFSVKMVVPFVCSGIKKANKFIWIIYECGYIRAFIDVTKRA